MSIFPKKSVLKRVRNGQLLEKPKMCYLMGLPINPKIHYRGAIAAKAAKALALSRFWDQLTLSEPGGQIMPTTVLWALSGSNSPWRPCILVFFLGGKGFKEKTNIPELLLQLCAIDEEADFLK